MNNLIEIWKNRGSIYDEVLSLKIKYNDEYKMTLIPIYTSLNKDDFIYSIKQIIVYKGKSPSIEIITNYNVVYSTNSKEDLLKKTIIDIFSSVLIILNEKFSLNLLLEIISSIELKYKDVLEFGERSTFVVVINKNYSYPMSRSEAKNFIDFMGFGKYHHTLEKNVITDYYVKDALKLSNKIINGL